MVVESWARLVCWSNEEIGPIQGGECNPPSELKIETRNRHWRGKILAIEAKCRPLEVESGPLEAEW
jgi:hypothetical protein